MEEKLLIQLQDESWEADKSLIRNSDGEGVCLMCAGKGSRVFKRIKSIYNKMIIVNAVNNYKPLLEACEAVLAHPNLHSEPIRQHTLEQLGLAVEEARKGIK